MKLLEPAHSNLSRFARAIASNTDDARDLVCETILRAYESFDNLKSKGAFTSFLFTIASRIHKRRNWRMRFFGEYDEQEAMHIAAAEPAPDSGLDVEVLYSAMNKLPKKVREAIALFEISGFSLEEIRQLQGGSLSGVKSRLKRGREKLAKLLGANDDDTLTTNLDKMDDSADRNCNPNGSVLKLYNMPRNLKAKVSNE